jgi:ferrochelatase
MEQGCQRVIVAPLYPQYASSSTGTALEELYRVAGRLWNAPALTVLPPFFDNPGFINAVVGACRDSWQNTVRPDHVLFSFHGLPERHVRKSIDGPGGGHLWDYQAQCYETAALTAATLGLDPDAYSVSFQSRLGRTPWIRPFTDEVIPQLAKQGVKTLAVLCPSFTADCLETLEEIGMRARDAFLDAGGVGFQLIPCVNDRADWAHALSSWVRGAAGQPQAAASVRSALSSSQAELNSF